jgi:hypothetical protein
MPGWKALAILALGIICLLLVLGAVLSPLFVPVEQRWSYVGGFAGGSVVMITLFVLFLRSADRAMMTSPRKDR